MSHHDEIDPAAANRPKLYETPKQDSKTWASDTLSALSHEAEEAAQSVERKSEAEDRPPLPVRPKESDEDRGPPLPTRPREIEEERPPLPTRPKETDEDRPPLPTRHRASEDAGQSAKHDAADSSDDDTSDSDSSSGGASSLKHKIKDKTESLAEKQHGPPGGFDETPLPDFPPGYTVKFTFHGASNLPIADIGTGACDPFVHVTLTAAVPKRHKEDPDLVFRTRTIRRDTAPRWDQEWVVANVPRSGFRIKCRIYDEDYPDHDDRLGNVTYHSPAGIDENWKGLSKQVFTVKKRMGSKRAYLLKAAEKVFNHDVSMSPDFEISIDVVGKSKGPGAQMYTVGPTAWIQHFSPMIGRLTGVKVNKDEHADEKSHHGRRESSQDRRNQKYDFQANEIQLEGPVSPKMYHRYVEFRPFVGPMFKAHGLRGAILNKMLHKQHRRIYNFDSSTKYGTFPPCSHDASLQFLKMAHFDEGWRIFTYVLTLDGLLRFTETGKEFGIDLLSKHTMHSNVQTYIACSGEFFIRRYHRHRHDRMTHSRQASSASNTKDSPSDKSLRPPSRSRTPSRSRPSTANRESMDSGRPPSRSSSSSPPQDPSRYELVIDNDSGTYRPDKSILPNLQDFFEKNFPGLHVTTMDCGDDEYQETKKARRERRKKEGKSVRMVLNRSPSNSSFSSSDESRLSDMDDYEEREGGEGGSGGRSKREVLLDVVEDPARIKTLREDLGYGHHKPKPEKHGGSSEPGTWAKPGA